MHQIELDKVYPSSCSNDNDDDASQSNHVERVAGKWHSASFSLVASCCIYIMSCPGIVINVYECSNCLLIDLIAASNNLTIRHNPNRHHTHKTHNIRFHQANAVPSIFDNIYAWEIFAYTGHALTTILCKTRIDIVVSVQLVREKRKFLLANTIWAIPLFAFTLHPLFCRIFLYQLTFSLHCSN